jgi:hypothetical protein
MTLIFGGMFVAPLWRMRESILTLGCGVIGEIAGGGGVWGFRVCFGIPVKRI